MAQDLTARKSNFLSACVANAQALKAARDQAKSLAEEYSNDGVMSGIGQGDMLGANSHLTPTILANYLTVVQPAVESNIHLANLLAMLSQ